MTLRSGAIFLLAVIGMGATVFAADWPQFRHDAGRTAASSESLPAKLHLQWKRELPPPRPAFPGEVRLLYDVSYEPVVAGKSMFVPSMISDTVTALDTDTGKVRWQFFTDGPVRFAPAVADSKVYAASDDGFLYCLHAESGALLWKFRGLPDDKTDRKILGNGRLISLWPARGAPVVADGVVYFAAGLWPGDGVYMHALEADSGKPIWSNTDSNRIPKANMDHGVAQLAGLTPQGYLAVVGDKLVVPCGTQLPALLDLKTGKLQPYTMGWGGRVGLPKGTWFVAGAGRHLTHSGDLYDITRANDEQFRDKRQGNFKPMLYPGGLTRLMIDPNNQRRLGPFQMPVITEQSLYINEDKLGIVAYDLTEYELTPRDELKPTQPRARDEYPDKWKADLRQRWNASTDATVHIKAGSRLYAARGNNLQAIDIPQQDEPPTVSWKAQIEGRLHRLLAADGKLFAVTQEGTIYAFGEQSPDELTTHRRPPAPKPSAPKAEPPADAIANIVQAAGVTEGYVLLLGVEDAPAIRDILSATNCEVVAVDDDAEKVAALRESFHAAGMYGTRVTVLAGDPLSCPLPPLLASLIVCQDDSCFAKGRVDASSLQSIVRLLRPYGGQACLQIAKEKRDEFKQVFNQAKFAGVELRETEQFVFLTRPGGLPGAADWSHAAASAANSGASQDDFLKPPLGLLWFDASLRWIRTPGAAEVRIADGRAIVLASRLHAIDVFTGRRLWERELPPGLQSRSNMVAADERIFLAARNKCLVLDAASGKELREISRPLDVTGVWSKFLVVDDSLIAAIGKNLVCFDHTSGEQRWKHVCGREGLGIAAGKENVFSVELLQLHRGESVEKTGTKMRAYDLKSGKLLWEVPGGFDVRYSQEHELLITQHAVFDATTGERVRAGVAAPQLVGDKIVSGTGDSFTVYDLATGERAGDPLHWFRRGCTGLRSSCHLVTTRFKANAAFVDLASREITPLWNIRPGCNNNLYPAEGILNVPNVTGGCECNYTPTSKAFAPMSLIERRP